MSDGFDVVRDAADRLLNVSYLESSGGVALSRCASRDVAVVASFVTQALHRIDQLERERELAIEWLLKHEDSPND